MALDAASPLPLYHQLAQHLLAQIRSGQLEVGDRIPSEHVLAERYAVGRPTVRQATDVLVRRGLLERRRGSGTFVCAPPPAVDLFSLTGSSAAFLEQGLHTQVTIVRGVTRELETDVAHPLGGREVYRVSRVIAVEGEPVVLEHIGLDAAVFTDFDKRSWSGRSLSELVRTTYDRVPEGAVQSFRVGRLPAEQAHWLAVSSRTPLLCVHRRLSFSEVGEAVVVDMICRTERYAFSQHLTAGGGVTSLFGQGAATR